MGQSMLKPYFQSPGNTSETTRNAGETLINSMFSDTDRVKLGQGHFTGFGLSENDRINTPNVAPDLASGVRGPIRLTQGQALRFARTRRMVREGMSGRVIRAVPIWSRLSGDSAVSNSLSNMSKTATMFIEVQRIRLRKERAWVPKSNENSS